MRATEETASTSTETIHTYFWKRALEPQSSWPRRAAKPRQSKCSEQLLGHLAGVFGISQPLSCQGCTLRVLKDGSPANLSHLDCEGFAAHVRYAFSAPCRRLRAFVRADVYMCRLTGGESTDATSDEKNWGKDEASREIERERETDEQQRDREGQRERERERETKKKLTDECMKQ